MNISDITTDHAGTVRAIAVGARQISPAELERLAREAALWNAFCAGQAAATEDYSFSDNPHSGDLHIAWSAGWHQAVATACRERERVARETYERMGATLKTAETEKQALLRAIQSAVLHIDQGQPGAARAALAAVLGVGA